MWKPQSEVEMFSICEIAKQLTWMLNLLKEHIFNEFVIEPTTVLSENQSPIDWLKGAKSSNKTTHVNLNFHFVRDLIEESFIQLKYISTDLMVVDFLTKALAFEKLSWSLQQINLI